MVRILAPRNALMLVGLLCLLGGLAWETRRLYRKWSEDHLVKQARVFLDKGDYRSAALSARGALQINPTQLAACRIMAEIAETAGAPEAVFWRGRAAELEPENPSAVLAWASIALRHGNYSEADQALQRASGEARKTPRYHNLAGAMAMAMKQNALAELHFTEALRLQPADRLHQLNLATVQLSSSKAATAEAARRMLNELRFDPQTRALALRALLADALESANRENSLKYARELKNAPESSFRDQILHLGVLRRWSDPQFATFLESLKQRAQHNAEDVHELASWMNGNGRTAESLEWMRGLAAETRAQPQTWIAMAEAYLSRKDWNALLSHLESQPWGDLECLRLAYQSQALREQNHPIAARQKWRQSILAANNHPRLMAMLTQLADRWGCRDETEDLLWAQAESAANPRWALLSLYRRYRMDNNTRGLHKTASRIIQLDPSDFTAQNNLASFSILLNVDRTKAHDLARKLYQQNPSSPVSATTYALALHQQGRHDEALTVMNALSEEQLRGPSVAAYYGIILAATGEHEKAAKFLDISNSASLLPEEKKLVEEARRRSR